MKPLTHPQKKQSATRMMQGELMSHCVAEGREGICRCKGTAREQDGGSYRNNRKFPISHSPPPCHFHLLHFFFRSLPCLLSLPL